MPDLQHFLALIYTDDAARAIFLADPYAVARAAGFTEEEAKELAAIDRLGLEQAARSFARKRAHRKGEGHGRIDDSGDV